MVDVRTLRNATVPLPPTGQPQRPNRPITSGGAICRGDVCKGRIFGGWANCIHGWHGRLATLEAEAAVLRQRIADHPKTAASLHCLHCDRDVAPDECVEANPAGLRQGWWFHSCGDAVCGSGTIPEGMTLREFVEAKMGSGLARLQEATDG